MPRVAGSTFDIRAEFPDMIWRTSSRRPLTPLELEAALAQALEELRVMLARRSDAGEK